MSSKEIESRNLLEKLLRQCVEDVKQEVARKKVEGPNVYTKAGKKQKQISDQEKEKIIEVLLS